MRKSVPCMMLILFFGLFFITVCSDSPEEYTPDESEPEIDIQWDVCTETWEMTPIEVEVWRGGAYDEQGYRVLTIDDMGWAQFSVLSRELIARFEDANPGVRVNHRAPGVEQLRASIMAGQAADIIHISMRCYFLPMGSGSTVPLRSTPLHFVNLYDLMEADSYFDFDDYFANVFEALEVDGRLYVLPLRFAYNYFSINQQMPDDVISVYMEKDSISYTEMMDIFSNLPDEIQNTFDMSTLASRTIAMLHRLNQEAANYVVWGSDAAHSTLYSDDFINFLYSFRELIVPPHIELHNGDRMVGHGSFIVHQGSQSDPATMRTVFAWQSNMYHLIGYTPTFPYRAFNHPVPLVSNDGRLMLDARNMWDMYSILGTSENIDLAWEFLRFAASDKEPFLRENELRHTPWLEHIPIHRSVFEEAFHLNSNHARAMLVNEFRSIHDLDLNWGNLDAAYANWYEYQQQAWEWFERVNNMPVFPMISQDLVPVTEDIFIDFLQGNISPEETARQLHSRVTIMLNE